MIVLAVDEETYRDAWEEYIDQASREVFLHESENFYQELLKTNIEETSHISDIPEGLQEDIAEMGAAVYADQIERVMNSQLVGDEYELAAATAFLEPERQVSVGAQAQGMISANWETIRDETEYSEEQYREWIAETMINPWPPSHFDIERVERFKPPEDDRTFQ